MNLNLSSALLSLGAVLAVSHSASAQRNKAQFSDIHAMKFEAVKLPERIARRASKPMPVSSLPTLGRFQKPAGKGVPRGAGELTSNDYSMKTAKTVDEWFERMPNWAQSNKPKPDKTNTKSTEMPDETQNGRPYGVTKTDYSIYETPTEIVTYSPVDGFWLGALVQENGLRSGLGSLQEISIPDSKRAPFKVAIDVLMGNNFRNIGKPSYSQVSSAIGELAQQGNKVQSGGARTFKLTENYSEEQTAHELGLDARYLASTISASFSTKRSASRHTVTAAFTERAFTVQADFSGRTRREAFFSPTFTAADARELVEREYVTPTNLPAYIKSIAYGRVLLFNLSSKMSESEMAGAIEGSFKGSTWEVNPAYKGSEKLKSTEFELQVTSFGGPQSGFYQTIPATGFADVLATMKTFLQQKAPLTSMMPISYTANAIRDNQLAAMQTTTTYSVTKYTPNPIGERYRLTM
jgi:thiol-activated cytolysin